MPLTQVTFTGVDDRVPPEQLAAISAQYQRIPPEWGVLYRPEHEGIPRYPTTLWREAFLSLEMPRTAAHLCGVKIFDDLLTEERARPVLNDIKRYRRVQLNINARKHDFSEAETLTIYRRVMDAGLRLVLPYNTASAAVIRTFLDCHASTAQRRNIEILFDESMGLGQLPRYWPQPLKVDGITLTPGYAGGLTPSGLGYEMPRIARAAGKLPYWLDIESGVRTENRFDIDKVHAVLKRASGGIYIASKVEHAERWRALRDTGVNIIASWIDEAGEGESGDYGELSARCLNEVSLAERVVLYCREDDILKGALIEAGAALATGVPVFQVGHSKSISRVFVEHPLWHQCKTVQDALVAPQRLL